MLDEDDLITQLNLAEYREMEKAFRAIMAELRNHLREGRRIEPGRATVNVAALLLPFPRVVVHDSDDVTRGVERMHLSEEGFAAMRGLLSNRGIDELRAAGLPRAARSRRRLNRRMYRILFRLYVDYMAEVFQGRLLWHIRNDRMLGNTAVYRDLGMFRWHALQLRLAATAHLLRLPDPCALVDDGMRGIAFLINRLAVIPPSWK